MSQRVKDYRYYYTPKGEKSNIKDKKKKKGEEDIDPKLKDESEDSELSEERLEDYEIDPDGLKENIGCTYVVTRFTEAYQIYYECELTNGNGKIYTL